MLGVAGTGGRVEEAALVVEACQHGYIFREGNRKVLGDKGLAKFHRKAVDKGVDFGLLAVIQVGHNALEISIVGHKFAFGLA
jgi:hypothetical protein